MTHLRVFHLLFILTFLGLCWSTLGSPLLSRCDALICVHYSPPDSNHAKEAAKILVKARDEISADFLIKSLDTLHVVIISSRTEFKQYVNNGLPGWAHAFAIPAQRTMVVRSPRWDRPETSFRQVLVHELIHLILYERAGGRTLPRWLDEGLALFYSEHLDGENRTLLSKALSTGSLIPLREIDNVLQFQQLSADLAYQESYSAVRYLLATYDVDAVRHIITGWQTGEDMDTLFIQATGSAVQDFEQEWLRYLDKTEKWYWLSESDELLWIFVPILFLAAVIMIRWRNSRKITEWQQEEEGNASSEETPETPPEDEEENSSPRNSY